MECIQLFVPDTMLGSTVEAKVYRHIVETFESAISSYKLTSLAAKGETAQDYIELTSLPSVLEHFRVVGAQKIYKGTTAEWRCDIEAPSYIMKRFKVAQEVIA